MEEVSEEEQGCERGVPRSMCPWFLSTPALSSERGAGEGGGGLRKEWLRGVDPAWCVAEAAEGPRFLVRLFSPPPRPPAYLAASRDKFNNGV